MSPIKEAIEALPQLPAAKTLSRGDEDGAIQLGYTADQMREYALAALRSMPAEPVAWMWEHVTNANGHVFASGVSLKKVQPTNDTFWDGYTSTRVTPLFSTPQTELVAAEPVGWVAPRPDVVDWSSYEPDIGTPLYTTPPPAPVLSDAEIDAIFNEHHNPQETPWDNWRRFARAILGRARRGAK